MFDCQMGEWCACDPPCGSICAIEGCQNPAEVTVSSLIREGSVLLTPWGVSLDYDVWVCNDCKKELTNEHGH